MSGRRVMLLLVMFSAAMLCGAPALRADPIATDIAYSTMGWISNPGEPADFTIPISFLRVNGTLSDFHSIDLGRFRITSTPGITTTFTDTPFGIEFDAHQFDKIEADPPHGFKWSVGSFALVGRLNGTVTGGGPSNVVATVDQVLVGPLPWQGQAAAGHYVNGLPFTASDVKFPRQIDLSAGPDPFNRFVEVNVEVVPEPSSALVFLVGGSALGVWRLRRSARARRHA